MSLLKTGRRLIRCCACHEPASSLITVLLRTSRSRFNSGGFASAEPMFRQALDRERVGGAVTPLGRVTGDAGGFRAARLEHGGQDASRRRVVPEFPQPFGGRASAKARRGRPVL
jgi:hypothetical protein